MWLLMVLVIADTATKSIEVAPGESLSVHDVGVGPPVVLLPGLLGSAYGYRNVVRSLRDEGYRAITIEPLGVGRSSRPQTADYSLTAQAQRVGAVLDSLEVRDALLIAHSIGSSIALRLSYLRPDLVRGILSLEGGVAESATTSGFRRAMKLAPLLKLLGVGFIQERIEKELRESSHDPSWVTDEVVRRYTEGAEGDLSATIDAYVAMARATEPDSLAPLLPEIMVPVYLLIGGFPHGNGPRAEEVKVMTAGLPFFVVDTLPNVGHFPHEEAPDEVMYAVRRLAVTSDRLPQRPDALRRPALDGRAVASSREQGRNPCVP